MQVDQQTHKQKTTGRLAAGVPALLVKMHLRLYGSVPPLLAKYTVRTLDELQALKLLLLGDSTGGSGTVAVVGMADRGGAGKTTEVIRFAHDLEVQSEYREGIFFVVLGESAKPLDALAALTQAVSDAAVSAGGAALTMSFVQVEEGEIQLQTALAEKRVLLIIDDVWESSFLAARALKDVAGKCPRVQVLLTTRDAALVSTLKATPHHLTELSPAQALRMLADVAGLPTDAAAMRVARLCERLPLLLGAAGAMASSGTTWEGVEAAIKGNMLLWEKVRAQVQYSDSHPRQLNRSSGSHPRSWCDAQLTLLVRTLHTGGQQGRLAVGAERAGSEHRRTKGRVRYLPVVPPVPAAGGCGRRYVAAGAGTVHAVGGGTGRGAEDQAGSAGQVLADSEWRRRHQTTRPAARCALGVCALGDRRR